MLLHKELSDATDVILSAAQALASLCEAFLARG